VHLHKKNNYIAAVYQRYIENAGGSTLNRLNLPCFMFVLLCICMFYLLLRLVCMYLG